MSSLSLAERCLASANGLLATLQTLLFRGRGRVERIGVWRTGSIGDWVAALPSLQAVREAHPEAELVVITAFGAGAAPVTRELLEGNPCIDTLWVYDCIGKHPFALRKGLRKLQLQALVRLPQNRSSLLKELRDLLFIRTCGIDQVRGFAVGGLGWLNRRLDRALGQVERQREVDRLLNLSGARNRSRPVHFPLPELPSDLPSHGEKKFPPGPTLALCPGTKRSTNRWPAERFAAVGARWIERGGSIVLLGSPAEAAGALELAVQLGPRALSLCEQGSLLATARALQQCVATVTGDTGLMHLSAAVGTPTVVAFSAREVPGRWFPYGEGHRVLRQAPPCSPCWEERCPHDNRCMLDIEAAAVWDALLELEPFKKPGAADPGAPAEPESPLPAKNWRPIEPKSERDSCR